MFFNSSLVLTSLVTLRSLLLLVSLIWGAELLLTIVLLLNFGGLRLTSHFPFLEYKGKTLLSWLQILHVFADLLHYVDIVVDSVCITLPWQSILEGLEKHVAPLVGLEAEELGELVLVGGAEVFDNSLVGSFLLVFARRPISTHGVQLHRGC